MPEIDIVQLVIQLGATGVLFWWVSSLRKEVQELKTENQRLVDILISRTPEIGIALAEQRRKV